MTNPPIHMMWKEPEWENSKPVLAYDFVHDINESFMSMALCWVPSSSSWATIPVGFLTPIIITKKSLNEEITNE